MELDADHPYSIQIQFWTLYLGQTCQMKLIREVINEDDAMKWQLILSPKSKLSQTRKDRKWIGERERRYSL